MSGIVGRYTVRFDLANENVERGDLAITVRCNGEIVGTGVSDATGKNIVVNGVIAGGQTGGLFFLELLYGVIVDVSMAGTISPDGVLTANVQSKRIDEGGFASGGKIESFQPCDDDAPPESLGPELAGKYRAFAKDFEQNVIAYIELSVTCEGLISGNVEFVDGTVASLAGGLSVGRNAEHHALVIASGETMAGRIVAAFGAIEGRWYDGEKAALYQGSRHAVMDCAPGAGTEEQPPANDIVLALDPSLGVWVVLGDGIPEQISLDEAEALVVADVDGSGLDDVIADFGPEQGLWVRRDQGQWEKINIASPKRMAAGDLDGNGKAELIVDFGPVHGLWGWMNGSKWTKIADVTTDGLLIADVNGKGNEIIVGIGAVHGTWLVRDAGKPQVRWIKVNKLPPAHLAAVKLGESEGVGLVIDFGEPHGIWIRRNESEWEKINSATTGEGMVSGDLDGSGHDELIVDFGPAHGLWVYWNGAEWKRIADISPDSMAVGGPDVDGTAEVIASLGAGLGVWAYKEGSQWREITPNPAKSIATGNIDGN